jgi:oligoendopeptidase F
MSQQEYRSKRWSLDDLIPTASGPGMEDVFDGLEDAVGRLEGRRESIGPSIPGSDFAEILSLVEAIGHFTRRLNAYATLWLAEDSRDQAALALRGRVNRVLAEAKNRTLFFETWWKGLDDENVARLIAHSGDIRYYLETLRRFAPFTLSEPEEKVINVKNVYGPRGLETLYDMMSNAFTYEMEIDGETRSITRAELMVYTRDPSPERRAAAYHALYEVFGEQGGVLGQIYTYLVGDWNAENVGLRRMPSAISVRNLRNDLGDDVVDALLSSCRKNAALYQRYFRLKAKWLNQERLRRYDVYAPVASVKRIVPFEEGVSIVFESMKRFSEPMAELAKRVLVEDHLDSEVRPGKDTGAFCFGVVPKLTPWVLVNYNGRLDGVSTVAHELGHAVHAMLASDHSALTFRSSLPLAETASNFAEILLLQWQLDTEEDPAVRRHLLAKFVDDSYASILRQAYFVLFERDAHRLIVDEGATVDRLCEHYLLNLADQFGDALDMSDEFRWEWVSVPHIYQVPFYCYAYSFGLLLVLALYRQYEREGEAFVPRYVRMLSHGGSLSPMDVLDEAGVNVRDEAFWQGGFDVIAEMIGELERQ